MHGGHCSLRVNLELLRVDRTTQTRVVLPRVLSIRVALRVVDVLCREIAPQSLGRNFEFLGHISVSKEAAADKLGA